MARTKTKSRTKSKTKSAQSSRKRKQRRGGPRVASIAKHADRYKLYEESVQAVEGDVDMLERLFKKRYGRTPHLLREDFCGSAALACEWTSRRRDNRAWGIDLDPEPLEYCRQNHFPKLDPEARERTHLIEANVLDDRTSGMDITCAYNFSYFCFKTRPELLRYFQRARSSLAAEGLFIVDLYGGADAMRTMTEEREQEGFDYVWDQHLFDPVSHHAINYIHFEFPDGSKLRRAFTYDWRLWTIPELREVMSEAGFSETEVYWEGTDRKTNEGNGVYRKVVSAPDDPAFVSYIVAFS